jgi:hypothetical protein
MILTEKDQIVPKPEEEGAQKQRISLKKQKLWHMCWSAFHCCELPEMNQLKRRERLFWLMASVHACSALLLCTHGRTVHHIRSVWQRRSVQLMTDLSGKQKEEETIVLIFPSRAHLQ